MSQAPFQRVAVLGPGLLGGSLALAVRARFPEVEVRLWGRRREAVEKARALGIGHLADTDSRKVVAGADLIVLATPVGVMAEVLQGGLGGPGPTPAPGALVTDVGSVKRSVIEAIAPIAARSELGFIGSHPMAGSENAGLEHARSDLFLGAACIVTPAPDRDPIALSRLRAFWECLGMVVTEMDADAHDEVVARVSHLPHMAASAVAEVALGSAPERARFAGAGFRDTTRVAAGDADLWTGILLENRRALRAPLAELIAGLQAVADDLERGDAGALRHFLDRARKLRHSCPPSAASSEE